MSVENLDFNNDNKLNQSDIKLLGDFLKIQEQSKINEFISNLESDPKIKEILNILKKNFLEIIKDPNFKIIPENKENIIIFQFFAKFYLGKNIKISGELNNELEQIYLEFQKSNEIVGKVSNEVLNVREIQEIDLKAKKELGTFIEKKAKGIKGDQMLLGPTLDLSMAYVIGTLKNSNKFGKGQNLAYWGEKEWADYKKYLGEQGVPIMSPKEMAKISKVGYFSRLEGKPDGKWVAKHFPGGDEKLLLTHTGPVKFGPGNEYVKESLKVFEEIIKSGKEPNGIMMAHASYDIGYFPGIEEIIERDKDKYPYLKDIPFDEIPSSLNPYLNSYLRENLGYKGNIIPDWFSGMSAYMTFVDKVKLSFSTDNRIKIPYLSIMAGNTFITGLYKDSIYVLSSPEIWKNFEKIDPEGFKVFYERMLYAIKPFLKNINGDWELRLRDLIFLMMAEPDLKIGINDKGNGNFNINFKGNSHKIKDLISKTVKGENAELITKNVIESGLAQNDVWTRTGVQSLVYRQAFIEELYFKNTGKKLSLPAYPNKISEEDNWFEGLMKNKEFKKYYDSIDWNKLAEV